MENEQAQKRFYELLWPHLPAVLRTAQILCGGNTPDAEDLAQETLLKAYRAIERFEPGTDARAWLLTVLRNSRIDGLRSAKASAGTASLEELPQEPADRPAPEQLGGRDVGEDPQALLERFSDRQVIEALGRLPEEIRWTLLLVDVEGVELKQAAEVLDVPLGTIKSRAHRGRMMLKGMLRPLAQQQRVGRED